jgi:hypothetical protein
MIKMIPLKVLAALLLLGLAACNNKNEDVTDTVNKSGSIETAVHISHIDSLRDELITTHKVWVKQNVYKNLEYRDTIPSLGIQNTVAENEDGNTKQVLVPRDYEIYITVK